VIISYHVLLGGNVGKCKFRQEKINDIATISDEAFVLLILENIWDDMMSVKIKDYYRQKNARNVVMMRAVKDLKTQTHLLRQ